MHYSETRDRNAPQGHGYRDHQSGGRDAVIDRV